ncbi:MAG: YedE family putative selenium transporter [Acetivibrio sp.]
MKEKRNILIVGAIIGVISVALVYFGNPANMGFCLACFVRDTAGGLGLHRAEVVQYVRPELIGLLLGSCLFAFAKKEFSPRGGSSPFTRFLIAFFVMIGALMFLGCPFRMILRLAGGDLNAIIGLVGFIAGIGVGSYFLNKGFTLKRTHKYGILEGLSLPIISIVLLAVLLLVPSLLIFSAEGPGSKHAPVAIALAAGLIVGALAQRTRFCMVGGIRDFILFKESTLLLGFAAIVVVAFIGNMAMGSFHLGFIGQPIAHTDGLWNFLGMTLVGFGCVLIGGCPLRQFILAGEGNSDSGITIIGLLVGAAFCHNFKLASSPDGPTPNGKIAVLLGFLVLFVIAFVNSRKQTTDN